MLRFIIAVVLAVVVIVAHDRLVEVFLTKDRTRKELRK